MSSPRMYSAARVFEEGAADLHLGGHLGQLEGVVLEAADGPAEGLAHLGVAQGLLQALLGHGLALDADLQPLPRSLSIMYLKPCPPRPGGCQPAPGSPRRRARPCPACGSPSCRACAPGEARRVFLHHDQADALLAGRGFGLHGQHDQIGKDAVGDEGLLTVDDVVVAVPDGLGADGGQVRSGAGFGQADAGDDLAGGAARQEPFLDFFGCRRSRYRARPRRCAGARPPRSRRPGSAPR